MTRIHLILALLLCVFIQNAGAVGETLVSVALDGGTMSAVPCASVSSSTPSSINWQIAGTMNVQSTALSADCRESAGFITGPCRINIYYSCSVPYLSEWKYSIRYQIANSSTWLDAQGKSLTIDLLSGEKLTAIGMLYKGTAFHTFNYDYASCYFLLWRVEKRYDIVLDSQNGTGGTASVAVLSGNAMPSATSPTRAGYTFQGYYELPNGSGIKYYNADMSSARSYNLTQDITLYAKWAPLQYALTFNKQTGVGGTSSTTATMGSGMPSGITSPLRLGYSFQGYFDSAGGGTQYYYSDMTSAHVWDKAATSTLYAQWLGNPILVTFQTDVATQSSLQLVGSAYTTPPQPIRQDYAFLGWFTAPDGGTLVTNGTPVANPVTHTLYAQWEKLSTEPFAIDGMHCIGNGNVRLILKKGTARLSQQVIVLGKTALDDPTWVPILNNLKLEDLDLSMTFEAPEYHFFKIQAE